MAWGARDSYVGHSENGSKRGDGRSLLSPACVTCSNVSACSSTGKKQLSWMQRPGDVLCRDADGGSVRHARLLLRRPHRLRTGPLCAKRPAAFAGHLYLRRSEDTARGGDEWRIRARGSCPFLTLPCVHAPLVSSVSDDAKPNAERTVSMSPAVDLEIQLPGLKISICLVSPC